jgi:pyrroline-5-carboxylate reductase
MDPFVKTLTIGFMRAGNKTQTIVTGWLEKGVLPASGIYCTNRSESKLKKFTEQTGVHRVHSNEELIEICDVVVLAMKPQDLLEAIENLSPCFKDDQVVLSLAAGIPIRAIQKNINAPVRIARLMPNTPMKIAEGVMGYATSGDSEDMKALIESLFQPIALTIEANEGEAFEALTVSAASGVGFVFELMIYWQEWLEEHNFEPQVAREMTVQTFLGAAKLAQKSSSTTLDQLLSNVISKKGVTAAGLQSMRELEIERGLRYSFEKAVMRDQELAK